MHVLGFFILLQLFSDSAPAQEQNKQDLVQASSSKKNEPILLAQFEKQESSATSTHLPEQIHQNAWTPPPDENSSGSWWAPQRRDSFASREYGHFFFPVATNVPGVGSAFGGGLVLNNIQDTTLRIQSVVTIGDVSTAVVSLSGLGSPDSGFSADGALYSTHIPFRVYARGNFALAKDYFTQSVTEAGGTLFLHENIWQKRIGFHLQLGASRIRTAQVIGPDGDRYVNKDDSGAASLGSTLSFLLDLTDNALDPKRGWRLELIRDETTIFDGLHARFASYDLNTSIYLPMGKKSTLAFNYFLGGAGLISKNTRTENDLHNELSLNCNSISDPELNNKCSATENLRVAERLSENDYGSASGLGAPMQMRSFPLGRFHGSKTEFASSELRLNFGEENSHFDFGFLSGTLMTMQLALFADFGHVAEYDENLLRTPWRSSYGAGFRLGFSGSFIRADIGVGNEGSQLTFFVGYPWGLSPF